MINHDSGIIWLIEIKKILYDTNDFYGLEGEIMTSPRLNVLDLFSDVLVDKYGPDEILTHYTSLDGFRKIIESGELWASNVRFLNDRKEMDYGIEQSFNFLESAITTGSPNGLRDLVSLAKNRVEDDIRDIYACCFSEENDSLGQWRGYSGDNQGIAIDFRLNELQRHFGPYMAIVSKVRYGDSEATKAIKEKIEGLLDLRNASDALITHEAAKIIKSLLLGLIPLFKHQSFRNEAEWRLVALHPSDTKTIRYRTSDNVFVPYLCLGDKTRTLPISSVRIGPGKDMELTRKSVEHFLNSRDGYEHIIPVLSDVPYRR